MDVTFQDVGSHHLCLSKITVLEFIMFIEILLPVFFCINFSINGSAMYLSVLKTVYLILVIISFSSASLLASVIIFHFFKRLEMFNSTGK